MTVTGDVMGELAGKVVLATGSMSGIGLAVASRFAREGASVVLNSRHPPAAPVRLEGTSTDFFHVVGDVANEAAVQDMVRRVEDHYGRLDILVNCAGTTVFVDHADLGGVTVSDWHRILDVNLIGAWNTIKAAEPLLRRSGSGSVINITSMAAIRPAGSSVPYAVSKAALNHLTALLARALGPEIRVNAIAPGFIQTGWTKDYNDRRRQVERDAPLRRVGLPEEVAEVALALVRAAYVTGQIILVDGGLSLL